MLCRDTHSIYNTYDNTYVKNFILQMIIRLLKVAILDSAILFGKVWLINCPTIILVYNNIISTLPTGSYKIPLCWDPPPLWPAQGLLCPYSGTETH